ncbi:MAG: hypothetical protein AB7P99_11345 [Vicinamibacterales bacterium]
MAHGLLCRFDMAFAALVDRVRDDFLELPNLELSLAQAVRLWGLGADDARFVLDSLVDVGFLRWTPRRTVVRASRASLPALPEPSHISVYAVSRRHKSVG